DVEDHREAARVRRVDEPLERERSAVARLRRADVDAVVAPVPMPRKLPDRHELDGGDSQLAECIEPLDGSVERPLCCERADVQLVDDEILDGYAGPPAVVPRELGAE